MLVIYIRAAKFEEANSRQPLSEPNTAATKRAPVYSFQTRLNAFPDAGPTAPGNSQPAPVYNSKFRPFSSLPPTSTASDYQLSRRITIPLYTLHCLQNLSSFCVHAIKMSACILANRPSGQPHSRIGILGEAWSDSSPSNELAGRVCPDHQEQAADLGKLWPSRFSEAGVDNRAWWPGTVKRSTT